MHGKRGCVLTSYTGKGCTAPSSSLDGVEQQNPAPSPIFERDCRCTSLEEWTDKPELFRRAVAALALSPEQCAQLLCCRDRWLLDLER